MLDELARAAGHLQEAHLAGADGMALYAEAARARQVRRAADPMNRLAIVTMTPAEFLSLARPIYPEDEVRPGDQCCTIQDDKLASIRRGIAGEGLDNLPYLHLQPEGEDARVYQHEGRHRALVAQRLGIARLPVQLVMGVGHAERPDDGVWHLMRDPPRHLLGESHDSDVAVPMPDLAVSRGALDLDDDEADRFARLVRTVSRVVEGYPEDPGECPEVRAWAGSFNPGGFRLWEPGERVSTALESFPLGGPAAPSP